MPRRRDDDWFFSIGAELQRLSDEVMRGIVATSSAARQFWRPNVDITETESELFLTVELAGVDVDTVTLQFSPHAKSLTIRGTRVPPADNEMRSRQLEIFYGDFERTLTLPGAWLVREQIRARMENGFLCIAIPKRTSPSIGELFP